MIAAVALSPSLDRTLVVDRLAVGGISRPDIVVAVAGGKGFNVARAAHVLGVAVTAYGVLGGLAGRAVAESLRRQGIPIRDVPGEAETRTCTSIAARDDGSLTELYEPSSITGDEFQQLADLLVDTVSAAQWVSLSGSLPADVQPERLRTLIERLRGRGARIAVDTSGPALATAVAAGPDLIKVNSAEATELVGAGSGAHLVRALQARTGGAAVVTSGIDGAYACFDRHSGVRHVHGPTRGDYPVGSGDSFLAGLLSVLAGASGGPLETETAHDHALRRASAAATANALQPGAAVFERGQVDELEKQLTLDRHTGETADGFTARNQ